MSFSTGNTWYRKVHGEKGVFIPSLSQLVQFPSLEFSTVSNFLRFFPETMYSKISIYLLIIWNAGLEQ